MVGFSHLVDFILNLKIQTFVDFYFFIFLGVSWTISDLLQITGGSLHGLRNSEEVVL